MFMLNTFKQAWQKCTPTIFILSIGLHSSDGSVNKLAAVFLSES